MESSTPPDIQKLLNRLGELEKKLTRLEAENTHLKSELARKDKIIAGLQQRLCKRPKFIPWRWPA